MTYKLFCFKKEYCIENPCEFQFSCFQLVTSILMVNKVALFYRSGSTIGIVERRFITTAKRCSEESEIITSQELITINNKSGINNNRE